MWPFSPKKKEPKPKVFCRGCKFFKITPNTDGEVINNVIHKYNNSNYVCTHDINVHKEYSTDDAIDRGTGKLLQINYKKCCEANENNDCFWFKPKDKKEK